MLSKGKNMHSYLVGPKYHTDDCLLDHMMLVVISLKTKKPLCTQIFYQLYPFVPHGPKISDPLLLDIFKNLPNSDSDNAAAYNFFCNINNDAFQLLNQSEHSDLMRDSVLPKGSAETLGSKL